MRSISIYDGGDNRFLCGMCARELKTVLRDAIAHAHSLVGPDRPDVHLRDCLGGLRAEVRWRDGVITVHLT